MCAAELDKDKLEEIWKEKTTAAFDEFIEENLKGPIPQKEPLCYGSGDGSSYCSFCSFQDKC